jgi:hypothetical protein
LIPIAPTLDNSLWEGIRNRSSWMKFRNGLEQEETNEFCRNVRVFLSPAFFRHTVSKQRSILMKLYDLDS